MHRPLAALAFALLLAAAAPGTTLSSETTADLIVLAERVCCAVVDSVESRRDPRSGFVFTHVRVRLLEEMKGRSEDPVIELRLPGGRADGVETGAGGLADAGYEITEYYPSGSNRIAHLRWKSFDISTDLKMIEQVHFADLWMLRLVPTFLNQETFVVHKERGVKRGIISLLLEKWFPLSDLDYLPARYKKTLEEPRKDERKRPRYGQYVWAHLYLPHGPYNLNRNCEYQLNAGYTEQALCSIKLMDDFTSESKREGKYDSAMIIFHADHGSVAVKDHDMTGENGPVAEPRA